MAKWEKTDFLTWQLWNWLHCKILTRWNKSEDWLVFQGCIMFRNVYFIPGTRSISFREFRVVFNAKVRFLPGITKYAYFIPRSGYMAFGTLYTPVTPVCRIVTPLIVRFWNFWPPKLLKLPPPPILKIFHAGGGGTPILFAPQPYYLAQI